MPRGVERQLNLSKFARVNMNLRVKISVNRRLILPRYDHLYVTPRGDKFPSSGCQHQRLMTVLEGRDIKLQNYLDTYYVT